VKGKWARGIAPRFFAWIIKDKLAVSERPGGYARNHRRVRRQEEILWLRGEGFTRVVSLLTSPHNLHAYDELEMAWAHIPFGAHDDPHAVLPDLYIQLREWMGAGERLLVHHEELSDRLMGVVAGYLRWSGLVPDGPQAITVVERIMHRQMGPDGRELVALAPQLSGAGGCATTVGTRGRTSDDIIRARHTAALKAAAAAAAAAAVPQPEVVTEDGPGGAAESRDSGTGSPGDTDGERPAAVALAPAPLDDVGPAVNDEQWPDTADEAAAPVPWAAPEAAPEMNAKSEGAEEPSPGADAEAADAEPPVAEPPVAEPPDAEPPDAEAAPIALGAPDAEPADALGAETAALEDASPDPEPVAVEAGAIDGRGDRPPG
jgi:hypothetical protein